MEKSVPELAKELLKKNKYADHNDVIEVKNEHGNQFTFLFDSTGYNEYTQHILECQSDLFEKPISFCLTTISDSFDFREIEYNAEPVSKHEETLRRAIELALPVKPTERRCSREIQN